MAEHTPITSREQLGITSNNQLIITSNNQLICTTNLILEAGGLETISDWVYDNGTVILIEGHGKTCMVRMIHPKEVSDPTRFVSLETFNERFRDELSIPLSHGKKKYIVRHGHAGHNKYGATLEESHDASLTLIGRKQAEQSGIAIFENSQGCLLHLTVYVSDLVRTMETAKILLDQFSEENRVQMCEVLIAARENIRPIKGTHHWKRDDHLREIAIDPFLPIERLRDLAPGKTDIQIEQMRRENLPRNDPIGNPDECIRKIGELTIDWSVYIAKLEKAYAEKKTFGQAASEELLFDFLFEKNK
jgi:bisphosphoglycerate-dependent phosphoglycerate mutase